MIEEKLEIILADVLTGKPVVVPGVPKPYEKGVVVPEKAPIAPIFLTYLKQQGFLPLPATGGPDPMTLFIPTDVALTKLTPDLYEAISKDKALQRKFVEGHMIRGKSIELKVGGTYQEGVYVLRAEKVGNYNVYLMGTPLLTGIQGDLARFGGKALKVTEGPENDIVEVLEGQKDVSKSPFYKEIIEKLKKEPRRDGKPGSYLSELLGTGNKALLIPGENTFGVILRSFISTSSIPIEDKAFMVKRFLIRLAEGQEGLQPGQAWTETDEALTVTREGEKLYLSIPGRFYASARLLATGKNCSIYVLRHSVGLFKYFDDRFGYSRSKDQNTYPTFIADRGAALTLEKRELAEGEEGIKAAEKEEETKQEEAEWD
jgi:hypothetical protein